MNTPIAFETAHNAVKTLCAWRVHCRVQPDFQRSARTNQRSFERKL